MWSTAHEFRELHLRNAFVEFVSSFNNGRNAFMKRSLRNNGSRRGNEADGCAPLRGNPPRYLGGYVVLVAGMLMAFCAEGALFSGKSTNNPPVKLNIQETPLTRDV